jgi:hypothetical protein
LTGAPGMGSPMLKGLDVQPAKDPYATLIATVQGSEPPHSTVRVKYTFLWQGSDWKIDDIEYVSQPASYKIRGQDEPNERSLKAILARVK